MSTKSNVSTDRVTISMRVLNLTHSFVADKADKKAEIEKTERLMQVQQERNEEMRELAIKLRKR